MEIQWTWDRREFYFDSDLLTFYPFSTQGIYESYIAFDVSHKYFNFVQTSMQ